MKLVLWVVIIILLSVIIYDKYRLRRITKDIKFISDELNKFNEDEMCKTLLLPTDKLELRKLLVGINDLINFNRREKTLRINKETTINNMLSNVSHDLKTPLTVIMGYIEILIKDSTISEDERNEILNKINTRSKEVLELVNKFFTLAKLESGDKKIDLEKIDLREISREIILYYYDILSNEEFQVNINMPEESAYVLGNKEGVERVINNLINNAYKYGGSGKYLGFNIIKDEENTFIEVIDRGRGISKEEQKKVFERSYIGESSRNKEASGSGLGLAISKKLVENMEGAIEVESEQGKETVFRVALKNFTV